MNLSLPQQIEAILFFRNEPLTHAEIAKILELSLDAITEGVSELEKSLEGRGVTLMRKDEKVFLATSPEASSLIEKVTKEELSKDIGKAGLETLAIVVYKGPVARSEIDYIRGVNSTFILRNLLIRDLIERIPNPADSRGFLYRPSFNLLSHLGVSNVSDLPQHSTVVQELATFLEVQQDEQKKHEDALIPPE